MAASTEKERGSRSQQTTTIETTSILSSVICAGCESDDDVEFLNACVSQLVPPRRINEPPVDSDGTTTEKTLLTDDAEQEDEDDDAQYEEYTLWLHEEDEEEENGVGQPRPKVHVLVRAIPARIIPVDPVPAPPTFIPDDNSGPVRAQRPPIISDVIDALNALTAILMRYNQSMAASSDANNAVPDSFIAAQPAMAEPSSDTQPIESEPASHEHQPTGITQVDDMMEPSDTTQHTESEPKEQQPAHTLAPQPQEPHSDSQRIESDPQEQHQSVDSSAAPQPPQESAVQMEYVVAKTLFMGTSPVLVKRHYMHCILRNTKLEPPTARQLLSHFRPGTSVRVELEYDTITVKA